MMEGARRRGPIPVLMYHDLGDPVSGGASAHNPYVVSEAAFAAQMSDVAAYGLRGTSLEDLFERAQLTGEHQGRPCVITFDDGHKSNITRALPTLLRAGFRATFFVTAGWIGRSPYMTWEQLRELAAAGMEIGSHSMTHRPPASLGRAELIAEMVDSKKLLEDRLGLPVRSASSPTGFFNPAMVDVAMEAGYRALCVGRIALWEENEPSRIPRLPIKRGTSRDDFRRMVLGERRVLAFLRGEQILRDGLKTVLGVEAYLRLRGVLMRLFNAR